MNRFVRSIGIVLRSFLKKGINTRGKLLKILKDGYQMYKDNLGIEDEFELQRDSFWADMDED